MEENLNLFICHSTSGFFLSYYQESSSTSSSPSEPSATASQARFRKESLAKKGRGEPDSNGHLHILLSTKQCHILSCIFLHLSPRDWVNCEQVTTGLPEVERSSFSM